MKVPRNFMYRASGLLLAVFCAALLVPEIYGQSPAGTVQVRGLVGSVTYATGEGAPMPARAGETIPVGALIKTAPGAAVDLAFSHNAGVVRLLQDSALSLNQFTIANAPSEAGVEVQLHLIHGTMVGFDKKLAGSSKYQIKVTDGIADISGSKYRINAQGYLVLLEGTALFVFIPPSGEPLPFELKAPPPVYFSPVEGVRHAPDQLVREVQFQTKGKLRH